MVLLERTVPQANARCTNPSMIHSETAQPGCNASINVIPFILQISLSMDSLARTTIY
jgi:hypothetical protein